MQQYKLNFPEYIDQESFEDFVKGQIEETKRSNCKTLMFFMRPHMRKYARDYFVKKVISTSEVKGVYKKLFRENDVLVVFYTDCVYLRDTMIRVPDDLTQGDKEISFKLFDYAMFIPTVKDKHLKLLSAPKKLKKICH